MDLLSFPVLFKCRKVFSCFETKEYFQILGIINKSVGATESRNFETSHGSACALSSASADVSLRYSAKLEIKTYFRTLFSSAWWIISSLNVKFQGHPPPPRLCCDQPAALPWSWGSGRDWPWVRTLESFLISVSVLQGWIFGWKFPRKTNGFSKQCHIKMRNLVSLVLRGKIANQI